MTPVAPHITAFLRERLPLQRGASEHTSDSYTYAFQLLFQFASDRLGVTPSALCVEQLDASFVMDFLQHLETARHNSPRTRNARLVAIKSFMRFLEHRVPSLLEHSRRILALPAKRTDLRAWLALRGQPPVLELFVNARDQAISVAERLTKASAWYPWHQEEVHHGDHQALGTQWRRDPSGSRVGRTRPPRYRERRVDRC